MFSKNIRSIYASRLGYSNFSKFGIPMIISWATKSHRQLLYLLKAHCCPQQDKTKICELSFSQFSYHTCIKHQSKPNSCFLPWHWIIGPLWCDIGVNDNENDNDFVGLSTEPIISDQEELSNLVKELFIKIIDGTHRFKPERKSISTRK